MFFSKKKYMGRKRKKVKKEKPIKTREEREKDINKAKLQLSMLGFGVEIPGIKQAYEIFDKYIEEGNYEEGKIKLEGCKRILKFYLYTRPGNECMIMLEYNQEV